MLYFKFRIKKNAKFSILVTKRIFLSDFDRYLEHIFVKITNFVNLLFRYFFKPQFQLSYANILILSCVF